MQWHDCIYRCTTPWNSWYQRYRNSLEFARSKLKHCVTVYNQLYEDWPPCWFLDRKAETLRSICSGDLYKLCRVFATLTGLPNPKALIHYLNFELLFSFYPFTCPTLRRGSKSRFYSNVADSCKWLVRFLSQNKTCKTVGVRSSKSTEFCHFLKLQLNPKSWMTFERLQIVAKCQWIGYLQME